MTDYFVEMDLDEFQKLKTPIEKYRNQKVHADGKVFGSQLEYRRWTLLVVQQEQGLIRDLKFHPKFVIMDGFRDRYGKKQQTRYYELDFSYIENGTEEQVAEDTKGVETAMFRLKRALFLKRYPDWDLRILKKGDF